jgi:hypothetical protein
VPKRKVEQHIIHFLFKQTSAAAAIPILGSASARTLSIRCTNQTINQIAAAVITLGAIITFLNALSNFITANITRTAITRTTLAVLARIASTIATESAIDDATIPILLANTNLAIIIILARL